MVFILISYVIAALYMFKALSAIPPIRKSQLIVGIIFGFLLQYYSGPLLGYLYQWVYFGVPPTWENFGVTGRYFYSVFFVMLFYALFVCFAFGWPAKKVMDHYAIVTPMMSGIGRIGCFFQGCCEGKPTSLPWGLRFPQTSDTPTHPTQIYMFLIEMALLAYLLRLERRKKYDSQVFWTGVFLYSIYRFFIEFLRTNPLTSLGLTHAQLFSLFTVALALWILGKNKPKAVPS